jgi:hypothetical protein
VEEPTVMEVMMTNFDFSEYFDFGDMYSGGTGDVRFEFVDSPRLDGEHVEFSFRTVGGATAPAGSVVAQIAVISSDNLVLGGGATSIRNELGPHDVAASRINPLQYTREAGDYSFAINVGGDTRNVEYRVDAGRVTHR